MVEDLVEFAKIERSGGTVPQLTKTGKASNRYPAPLGLRPTLWCRFHKYNPSIITDRDSCITLNLSRSL